jgi:hypothetical protein
VDTVVAVAVTVAVVLVEAVTVAVAPVGEEEVPLIAQGFQAVVAANSWQSFLIY